MNDKSLFNLHDVFVRCTLFVSTYQRRAGKGENDQIKKENEW